MMLADFLFDSHRNVHPAEAQNLCKLQIVKGIST
jgi:hypothetical protein